MPLVKVNFDRIHRFLRASVRVSHLTVAGGLLLHAPRGEVKGFIGAVGKEEAGFIPRNEIKEDMLCDLLEVAVAVNRPLDPTLFLARSGNIGGIVQNAIDPAL